MTKEKNKTNDNKVSNKLNKINDMLTKAGY